MKAIILAALLLLVLAWCARREGFLPYPAAPISITIQQDLQFINKDESFKQALDNSVDRLIGFNLRRTPECKNEQFDDPYLKTETCWSTTGDVPFFGGSSPGVHDTIYVLAVRYPETAQSGDRMVYHTITVKAAYASYGSCWLEMKRQSKQLDDADTLYRDKAAQHGEKPRAWSPTLFYCEPLTTDFTVGFLSHPENYYFK